MPPELDERARGWLRYLWRKATTPDDWSRTGEPLPWWDRYSLPPMLNFARFDLSESSYALALMADRTPAWREAYGRILDELVGRHTTFWAAIDWLTQIGPDPKRREYPKRWKGRLVPKHLWGDYDAPGWTANGVEPWGLQPDPIGSDGNLFFRGFFTLLLSIHRYVSGDDRWTRPFPVAGFEDQTFEWTHPRIAEFLEKQWTERPEGPHCENTKIWPYCLSAAGLGLQLTDHVLGTQHHWVYDRWVEDVLEKKYMGWDKRGGMKWMAIYYDPLIDHLQAPSALAGLAPCFYVLPQNRALAETLYRKPIRMLGWNRRFVPLLPLPERRFMTLALVMAQELGDDFVARRLRKRAERLYEPRFFGEGGDEFGWWFKLGEPNPRGQESALMMMADLGSEGAWWRVFNAPNLAKFDEPTVSGVDYPSLGLSQAWNDPDSGVLHLASYAATSSQRGQPTRFRVEKLPQPDRVRVLRDGETFPRWRAVADDAIEIETDVATHRFEIVTGVHGAVREPDARPPATDRTRKSALGDRMARSREAPRVRAQTLRVARRHLVSGASFCPCCTPAL